MEIKIRSVHNGYIVSSGDDPADFQEVLFEMVDDDEKATLTNVFIYLADYFGKGYNGFEKDNLNIQWNRKGDELE